MILIVGVIVNIAIWLFLLKYFKQPIVVNELKVDEQDRPVHIRFKYKNKSYTIKNAIYKRGLDKSVQE